MLPNPQFPAVFTFTEEIRNGKLNFLCCELFSVMSCCKVILNPHQDASLHIMFSDNVEIF